MDQRFGEIVEKIDGHLGQHPNISIRLLAGKLGLAPGRIEEALAAVEGISFEQFREAKRLERAFEQLGALSPAANGPYDVVRARRRLAIPRATVRYGFPSFYRRRIGYSHPCPMVDLSRDGTALLADSAESPGRRVALLLKFPGVEHEACLEGRVVYAVATGIAGYRYRVGIRFLPFVAGKGGNDLRVLEILEEIERQYAPRTGGARATGSFP